MPQQSAVSPIVDGVRSPQHRIADDANVNEYLYWMAGATACGVLFAFVATFGLSCLEYGIFLVRDDRCVHGERERERVCVCVCVCARGVGGGHICTSSPLM